MRSSASESHAQLIFARGWSTLHSDGSSSRPLMGYTRSIPWASIAARARVASELRATSGRAGVAGHDEPDRARHDVDRDAIGRDPLLAVDLRRVRDVLRPAERD